MFNIVPLNDQNIQDIYYLQLHLAIDHEMISSFTATEEELLEDFKKKLYYSYMLCNPKVPLNRSIGCLLYCDSYSFKFNHGFYIDSYYVMQGLREKGLGRLLMKRLCDEVLSKNYEFIKIHYLNRPYLRTLYSKMGFCNETQIDKKLQLLEAYGKPALDKFIKTKIYPTVCTSVSEVVVNVVSSTVGKSNARMVNIFLNYSPKTAGFVEEVIYSGWIGQVLEFKDFVGSTEIIDVKIFQDRYNARVSEGHNIKAIWWEVSLCEHEMIHQLELAKVQNTTVTEGWQIAYLYRSPLYTTVSILHVENMWKKSDSFISDWPSSKNLKEITAVNYQEYF